GPLFLLVLGLAGTAVRERFPAYAFGAGLVLVGTVGGGYALAIVTGGGAIGGTELVHMTLLVSLAASLYALGWLGCRQWLPQWPRFDPGLGVQAWLGFFGLLGLATLALAR